MSYWQEIFRYFADQIAWPGSSSPGPSLRGRTWQRPIFQSEFLNLHLEETPLGETRSPRSVMLRVLFGISPFPSFWGSLGDISLFSEPTLPVFLPGSWDAFIWWALWIKWWIEPPFPLILENQPNRVSPRANIRTQMPQCELLSWPYFIFPILFSYLSCFLLHLFLILLMHSSTLP